MTDTPGDRWIGITYLERPSLIRRLMARPVLMALVAVALGVAFGLGVLAIRDLGGPQAIEPSESSAFAVPVEIAPPQPAPPPAPAAPMEVLPSDTPPATAPPAAIAPVAPTAPRERADPNFDCRRRNSESERLICGNAELTALDRRMNRAFDAAVAAGAPMRSLRHDQDDWLRIREDAAQHQPDGVADMYRQRIMELEEIAANF